MATTDTLCPECHTEPLKQLPGGKSWVCDKCGIVVSILTKKRKSPTITGRERRTTTGRSPFTKRR